MKRGIVVFALLALVAGGVVWRLRQENGQAASFRTEKVTRGDLIVYISATGTVEPEEVVNVGAQVAGKILSFGQDGGGQTVDYGSVVEKGMVLARIDDALYQADLEQVKAQIQSAEAGVKRAQADLAQSQAKLLQAKRDWERAQKLGPEGVMEQSMCDSYEAAYESAKATVAVCEAAILQAKASVAQTETGLWRAQRNLEYCTITSPVKGVIIDRRVNTGQTVVASLNAPTLFLIAKDLKRMRVWVAVNEADVGRIKPGQPVTFTVDAFPTETFKGEVAKIRLNASMTQNVVTYTVEIATDNSSGRLLPYLTANVRFEVDRANDVLMAPNAALRWTPSAENIAPEYREGPATASGGASATAKGAQTNDVPSNRRLLWTAEGQYVRPIPVCAGLTDGVLTEVKGEGAQEGMEVVLGMQTSSASGSSSASSASGTSSSAPSGATTNPFTPKMPKPPKGARGGPPL